MNTTYPSTGNLLLKSGTAIEHLQQQASNGTDFDVLCKSLATDVQKPKTSAPSIDEAAAAFGNFMKSGANVEQIHQKRLAEVEMRKCMDKMRGLGKTAKEIAQFQQLTEAALNNPGIDNGMMVKSLTQLLNS